MDLWINSIQFDEKRSKLMIDKTTTNLPYHLATAATEGPDPAINVEADAHKTDEALRIIVNNILPDESE